jgi:hypothetical protein
MEYSNGAVVSKEKLARFLVENVLGRQAKKRGAKKKGVAAVSVEPLVGEVPLAKSIGLKSVEGKDWAYLKYFNHILIIRAILI